MKTTHYFLTTAILFASLSMTGCKEEKDADTSFTVEKLNQSNNDFAKTLVAKNADAAANMYTEDGSLLNPNEPTIKGRANIKKDFQGLINNGLVDLTINIDESGSADDLGYQIGNYELKFKDSTGNIAAFKGRFTEILKRDKDGKWLVNSTMFNSAEPAAK